MIGTEVLTDHVRLSKFNHVFSPETAICGFLCFFCKLGIIIDSRNAAFIDSFGFDAVGCGYALRAPCQLFFNRVSNGFIKSSHRADHFHGVRNDVVSTGSFSIETADRDNGRFKRIQCARNQALKRVINFCGNRQRIFAEIRSCAVCSYTNNSDRKEVTGCHSRSGFESNRPDIKGGFVVCAVNLFNVVFLEDTGVDDALRTGDIFFVGLEDAENAAGEVTMLG